MQIKMIDDLQIEDVVFRESCSGGIHFSVKYVILTFHILHFRYEIQMWWLWSYSSHFETMSLKELQRLVYLWTTFSENTVVWDVSQACSGGLISFLDTSTQRFWLLTAYLQPPIFQFLVKWKKFCIFMCLSHHHGFLIACQNAVADARLHVPCL